MGTAGGLRLIPRPNGPFLVINGDILTGVSYQQMLRFHRKHAATLTVGIRAHEVEVPFGVVECDEVRVMALTEKPRIRLLVNAGIYLLEPRAWDYLPAGRRFDMTDLIQHLLGEGSGRGRLPDHRVLAGRRPSRGLPARAKTWARWTIPRDAGGRPTTWRRHRIARRGDARARAAPLSDRPGASPGTACRDARILGEHSSPWRSTRCADGRPRAFDWTVRPSWNIGMPTSSTSTARDR